MLLGLATIALGVTGFAPLQCEYRRLLHFSHRLRTQAHTDSRQEQRQRAGHEPVCLVPGSEDKYLPVPDCTLQKSLDTHSEAFYSADIGISTDTTSSFRSTCVVLALVAGRLD